MSRLADAALRAATVFVARERELALLTSATRAAQTRGVHVWGPPGVGKTRLAREWARARADLGVVWCDLSDAADLPRMGAALALALDAPRPLSATDPLSDWAAQISTSGASLVVLDGVDGLSDACAALFEAAAHAAPELFWVTTSRRALSVDELTSLSLDALPPTDAVALFVERARRVHHEFSLDARTEAQLMELLGALDHLPLAIEWAASRVRLLPPGELLKRLERRRALMSDAQGARLEAALAGAYDDLPEHARRTLSRLTVFDSPFSLDAVEAILSDEPELLDALGVLIECSMLGREDDELFPGEVRLVVLETVAAFVRAHHAPPDLGELTARHAEHYEETSRANLAAAVAGEGPAHVRRVRADQANLRRAHAGATGERSRRIGLLAHELEEFVGGSSWALDALRLSHPDDPEVTLQIALWHHRRGEPEDADAAARRVESRTPEGSETWRRARLTRAELARDLGSPERAIAWLAPWAELEDATSRLMRAERARALADLGDLDAAAEELEALQALPAWGADARVESEVLRRVAYVCYYLRRPVEQKRAHQRGLACAQAAGHARRVAWHVQGAAEAAYVLDSWEDAAEGFERARARHQELGNHYSEGIVTGNLGAALHRLGRLDEAERHYLQARALHQRHAANLYLGIVTHALAALAHERGQRALAMRRYQEAASHYEAHGMTDDLAATLLCRGWLRLEHQGERAREDLVRAGALFDETSSPCWSHLAKLSLSLLGGDAVPRLDALTEPTHTIAALLRARGDAERVDALAIERPCVASLYGRLALALARSSAQEVHDAPRQEPRAPDLEVGVDTRWFRTAEQDAPKELGRRTSIRNVLTHLVASHGTSPGEPAEVYDLFDVGWPGQEIDPELAAERVYWAIRTLRNLGLRALLLTQDGGYLLDPNAIIRQDT